MGNGFCNCSDSKPKDACLERALLMEEKTKVDQIRIHNRQLNHRVTVNALSNIAVTRIMAQEIAPSIPLRLDATHGLKLSHLNENHNEDDNQFIGTNLVLGRSDNINILPRIHTIKPRTNLMFYPSIWMQN
eukprot:992352_1